ncbi:MAG: hemin uptake protein HemP [Roseivivax sp.]|nr:hemin uptake protein HemP [Roseivivax sp.]
MSMTTGDTPQRPVWRAEELCGDSGLATITLGTEVYVLRITRTGKLILTK